MDESGPVFRFYIEFPGDRYGNTGKPRAVVEATVVRGGPGTDWPAKDPRRLLMIPVAPPEIVAFWPGWYTDGLGGWAETAGPARMLTDDEYDAIIAGLTAGRRIIPGQDPA
jgi:hypothetical protein